MRQYERDTIGDTVDSLVQDEVPIIDVDNVLANPARYLFIGYYRMTLTTEKVTGTSTATILDSIDSMDVLSDMLFSTIADMTNIGDFPAIVLVYDRQALKFVMGAMRDEGKIIPIVFDTSFVVANDPFSNQIFITLFDDMAEGLFKVSYEELSYYTGLDEDWGNMSCKNLDAILIAEKFNILHLDSKVRYFHTCPICITFYGTVNGQYNQPSISRLAGNE